MRQCSSEGCEKPAARDRAGLCYACAKWRQRHPGRRRRPRSYGLQRGDRLGRVATELADAETNEQYDRARMRLLRYAQKAASVRIDELIERIARRVAEEFTGRSDHKATLSRSRQKTSRTDSEAGRPSESVAHGDSGTD